MRVLEHLILALRAMLAQGQREQRLVGSA